MSDRLYAYAASELGRLYAERALSPVEVVEAVLLRIEACEPAINAVFFERPDEALAEARESEERWRRGEPLGPLDGVPITLKDNIALAGTPMPIGTAAAPPGYLAEVDAPPAARVREAGCVVVGKTTMPDFGMLSSGVSSVHGITRNPWNLEMNPWGSSSGAAAGLAAGYGPLALGTDIGGSVRLPAGACGVAALKPSLGRVPIHPPYFGRVTGPMARSVADLALLMGVISRPDARDWMSLPPETLDWAAEPDEDLRGLRFGLLLEAGAGLATEHEVGELVSSAARAIEAAGGIVEPVRPFADRAMLDGLDRFFRCRAASDFYALPPARQAAVLPFLRAWLDVALSWSAIELFRSFNEVTRIRETSVAAMADFDFLLTPTAPIAGYAAASACPGDDPSRPFEHIVFTAPYNQSEQPAASVPCGMTSAGLPVGLQIVGRRFDDLGVLRVAAAYERLRPPQPPWPEPGP